MTEKEDCQVCSISSQVMYRLDNNAKQIENLSTQIDDQEIETDKKISKVHGRVDDLYKLQVTSLLTNLGTFVTLLGAIFYLIFFKGN